MWILIQEIRHIYDINIQYMTGCVDLFGLGLGRLRAIAVGNSAILYVCKSVALNPMCKMFGFFFLPFVADDVLTHCASWMLCKV